jgi:flagellar basal-body rod protein FlgG
MLINGACMTSSSFTQIINVTRSGMLTRLLDLDLVSNNISNINTNGFKHSRTNFQEVLRSQQLNGTQISATQHMMEQGSLQTTSNPLDLAVNGEGFFAVNLPDGRTAYTRDGEFYLDKDRQIVNASGFLLEWDGEIPEGAQNIHVNPDGTVMVQQEDETWTQVGSIELSRFPNPGGLLGYGQNLWLETNASGAVQTGTPGADGNGQILGSALERSNVSISQEYVQMITLQRSFEISLRTFQQTDQMLSEAINIRR